MTEIYNKQYTATVIEIDDEYYLEFPTEVIDELGWEEDDTLVWKDEGDGKWSLTKKDSN